MKWQTFVVIIATVTSQTSLNLLIFNVKPILCAKYFFGYPLAWYPTPKYSINAAINLHKAWCSWTMFSGTNSKVRSSVWEWFIGGFCKRRVCFRLMVCFGFLQAPLCPLRVVENVIVLVFYSKNDLASISKMVYFSSPQIWFSFDTSNRDVTLSYRYGPRIRLTETSGVTTRGKKGGGKQFWSCSFVFVLPSQISLFCWSILHLTCS